MFFFLSKIAWFVFQPLVAIIVLFGLGLLCRAVRLRRLSIALQAFAGAFLVVAVLTPAGAVMTAVLENRFPRPELPAEVAGVIVLGGSFDTLVAKSRGEAELNEAADRITAGVALARRYPDAKLVFTGGISTILEDDSREADSALAVFRSLGLPESRLVLESRARNTAENAAYVKALVRPKPGEVWLLVTSAFHMPRSVGCFRVAGFDVLPFPVDYRTVVGPGLYRPSSAVTRNVEKLSLAAREYVGLVAYRLTGRIDALFPAPQPGSSASSRPAPAAPSL